MQVDAFPSEPISGENTDQRVIIKVSRARILRFCYIVELSDLVTLYKTLITAEHTRGQHVAGGSIRVGHVRTWKQSREVC